MSSSVVICRQTARASSEPRDRDFVQNKNIPELPPPVNAGLGAAAGVLIDGCARLQDRWIVATLNEILRGSMGHVMPANTQRGRVAEKVRAYRARLRAQGLRPIQIWVPDVRSPTFRAEAHQQSMAVARSDQAEEDQAFIDAVSDGSE